jgi:hypothetical protein
MACRGTALLFTIQRENIRPSKEEMPRLLQCIQTTRCLQLGYESLRLIIADQLEVFRPPACFILPRTNDVYTPQGSTRDLLTLVGKHSSKKNVRLYGNYYRSAVCKMVTCNWALVTAVTQCKVKYVMTDHFR